MGADTKSGLIAAINDSRPVSGLSHTLYKYPGRFSPLFAREIIELMTMRGDVVLDPFVGGGTTLVEAMAAGRDGAGLDINELAVFVTRAKTTIFSEGDLGRVSECMDALAGLTLGAASGVSLLASDYAINLADPEVWRIRRFLGLCLCKIEQIEFAKGKELVRSVLLRTAQWALDCRARTPTLDEFRDRLKTETLEAVRGARLFREDVRRAGRAKRPRRLCLLRSAIGSEDDKRLIRFGQPSLVLTSPPYPGVHVLYHRWQVNGRRETAAPYWIAGLTDGHFASYYTFADRHRKNMSKYLDTARLGFASVRKIVRPGTPLVQMVAFADPDTQLGPYLATLADAGWTETRPQGFDSRLWRTVPGRRWYTSLAEGRAGRELVLFHRAS